MRGGEMGREELANTLYHKCSSLAPDLPMYAVHWLSPGPEHSPLGDIGTEAGCGGGSLSLRQP